MIEVHFVHLATALDSFSISMLFTVWLCSSSFYEMKSCSDLFNLSSLCDFCNQQNVAEVSVCRFSAFALFASFFFLGCLLLHVNKPRLTWWKMRDHVEESSGPRLTASQPLTMWESPAASPAETNDRSMNEPSWEEENCHKLTYRLMKKLLRSSCLSHWDLRWFATEY